MIRRTPWAAKGYLLGPSVGRTMSGNQYSGRSKGRAPVNTRLLLKVNSFRFLAKFFWNVKLSPLYGHLKPINLFYYLHLIIKCGRILSINVMRKWYIGECLKCQEPQSLEARQKIRFSHAAKCSACESCHLALVMPAEDSGDQFCGEI